MALNKPILLSQVAFDATKAQIIKFNVVGGSQILANKLKIVDNATGVEVYNKEEQNYRFEHTIPENTLINGTYYSMQVQTLDKDENTSVWSNTIQFYCYSTPIISITNMPINNTVTNATYNFVGNYSQKENEILNSYKFDLFNSSRELISTSGVKYGQSIIEHRFSGFEDNRRYYVELSGITINGTKITTGQIEFSVEYVNPNLFALLTLDNDCQNGFINAMCNIVIIEGESNPSLPIYIDGEKIDLRQDGFYVYWDKGFSINDDFTLKLWGIDFKNNKKISVLTNAQGGKIDVITRMFNGETFVELYATDNGVPYYCYSNEINETDNLFIWIRRINNLYSIKIEQGGVV